MFHVYPINIKANCSQNALSDKADSFIIYSLSFLIICYHIFTPSSPTNLRAVSFTNK